VYREPVRISLENFADRYMEYAKTNKRSWLRDEQLLKPLKEFFRIERQLAEITPPEIEGYKLWRRKQVSGATVNRELALLKHMFNLAIDWDLYLGSNPLRKVKFFQEVNTGFRVLKPDEETRLLRNATPAIQDVVLYALNTGSRIGEIFSLRWQNVDLDRGLINVFSPKTQKTRVVPIASKVVAVGKLAGAATNLLHLAPKCSSSNRHCSKLAANSQNTLELKTEEWVSG